MLWQVLGAGWSLVVLAVIVWLVVRSRRLHTHRLDLHIYVHRADTPDTEGATDHDPR